jgi:pyruvate formate lyase activating enzyme
MMTLANGDSRAESDARRTAAVETADPVPVAALTPLTTIDYPDALSAVLFLQGCPWRCPYCHNPELRPMRGAAPGLPWTYVREFLGARRGLLDAIVFSGGEPTIHPGLAEAMREVRRFGYAVGLHTNGAYPAVVRDLLDERLLDWVGLDLKAPRWLYAPATGVETTAMNTFETLRLLLRSGAPLDARTTVYRPLLDDEEVLRLAGELRPTGLTRLRLQPWRPERQAQSFPLKEDLTDLQRRVAGILESPTTPAPAMRATRPPESAKTPQSPVPLPLDLPKHPPLEELPSALP